MTSSVSVILTIIVIICSSHKGSSQCTTIDEQFLYRSGNHLISQSVSNQIIIMPFYKITCEGRISKWKVQINGQGTHSLDVTFTVWKPSDTSSSEYTLVGKNMLSLSDVRNVTTYELTPDFEDQISVEPGSVIGFHISGSEGPSSGVNAVSIDPNKQYSTYFIDSEFAQGADEMLDISMASVVFFNQIPLVTAEIVDKSSIDSATPSSSSLSNEQTVATPTPSISASPSSSSTPLRATVVNEVKEAMLFTSMPSSSATVAPTTPTSDNSNSSSVFVGPVIAISILTVIIIIGTVIFSIMMYYTIKRRQKMKKPAVDNPTYDCNKRKSSFNQCGYHFSRNPSYSPATLDYHKLRRKVMSEHVYESCYDPYEYLDPVSLAANSATATAKSLPVKSNRLTKVSAIYEIPFVSVNVANSPEPKRACAGVNNLYLTTSKLVQPAPISPGYDVPVCPDVPAAEKESLEESARYKEPGWMYHS